MGKGGSLGVTVEVVEGALGSAVLVEGALGAAVEFSGSMDVGEGIAAAAADDDDVEEDCAIEFGPKCMALLRFGLDCWGVGVDRPLDPSLIGAC